MNIAAMKKPGGDSAGFFIIKDAKTPVPLSS
jgi:hypothetical protein